MPVDPFVFESLIDGAREFLQRIFQNRHQRTEQVDNALTALYAAINETRIYVKSCSRKPRNTEKEAELARLWARAAVPIRHLDQGLAERCRLKADYWIDPDAWTVAQLKQFRLTLDEIYDYAGELLKA
jgi:hypothetical protein